MDPKPYLKEINLKNETIDDSDRYPFSIPAISNLKSINFHPDVTFIIGVNGAGKSTLIEAIALSLGFSPEGGTKNVRLQTHANTSELHQHLKLIKSFRKPKDYFFLRAESFYSFSSYMEETGYLSAYNNESIHTLSHGEALSPH
jgi:predicted ATPase